MFKRLFDFVAALLGLLLLSPVLLLVAALIKLDSPGPVFFRQWRVGRHGRLFRIYKFRTMVHEQPADASELTVHGDIRITHVGVRLRYYKLDELPQLIDVLRGTMSLVGPRPEVPRYVKHYPPEWRDRVLSVRPGITDLASVHYRTEGELLAQATDPEREYLDVILPSKLRYALYYVDRIGFADDLRVIGLTLRTVFESSPTNSRKLPTMVPERIWRALKIAMSSSHPRRRLAAAMVDATLVLLCWHFTYLFRLGFERYQPGRPWYDDYVSFGIAAAYMLSLWGAGVWRGVWRFFAIDDMRRIAWACMLAGSGGCLVVLMAQLSGVARAVLLLHPLFSFLALILVRMVYRILWERIQARVNGQLGDPRRAIVLGAGDIGRRLVAGIHLRDGWTVMGLLDDDLARRGSRVAGVPVLGAISDLMLPHIHSGLTHVILALPESATDAKYAALQMAHELGLPMLAVIGQADLSPAR